MIFLGIISMSVIFFTVIYLYLLRKFDYLKKRNVFSIPYSIPLGNAKDILTGNENIGTITTKVYNAVREKKLQYGGFYFLMRPILVIVDLNLLRNILITDFQHFTDHAPLVNEENDPLNAHLFNLTGAKWKALRTKLTPLFTSGKLKMMFQTFLNCTENFSFVLDQSLKNGEPVEIKDLFARFNTDIIGSVAFGIDCNCLKNPDTEFIKFGKQIFEEGFQQKMFRVINSINPKLIKLFRMKFTDADVERFFLNLVKETIEYREKNNFERKDFMQLLMNLRNQELKVESHYEATNLNDHITYYQNGLTLNEVAAEAFVFFAAGFETSSTTLNFLMLELVQHTDIQDKLRNEIKTVLKIHGAITYEAIQEMSYLDKCLYETLRKYPPIPITLRNCTKEYKIPDSDLIIEKGIPIMIPIYGIQHDPEYYPNPEKFDPERFTEENKAKRPATTFLAFGEGPRLCIGQRMGIMQTKVGLVALLKDYKFSLNHKTKLPMEFDKRHLILNVNGGVWVNVEKVV